MTKSALAGLRRAGRELVTAATRLRHELPGTGGDAMALGATEVFEGMVSSGKEARRVAKEEIIPAVGVAVRTACTEVVGVTNERIIPAAVSTGAAAHRIANEQIIPAVVDTAGKIADEAQRSMLQLGSFVADTAEGLLGERGAGAEPVDRRESGSRKAWQGPELD